MEIEIIEDEKGEKKLVETYLDEKINYNLRMAVLYAKKHVRSDAYKYLGKAEGLISFRHTYIGSVGKYSIPWKFQQQLEMLSAID